MVKTQFSIKDLENLSGVKAHTLRIWEKRYKLLTPSRTDTNIRQYDLDNLKKLLSVTLLYNNGHKISKIAALNATDIQKLITETLTAHESKAINAFKSAMFDFDTNLFAKTYDQLTKTRSFRSIFHDIFLPLLDEIGLLWQTGTIDPTHERFISELIRQKVTLQIEAEQRKRRKHSSPVFVLFLPYGEIHDIGLLYANYEILKHGFKAIYLGANIPVSGLSHVLKHHTNVTFLTYFTMKPDGMPVEEYITSMRRELDPSGGEQIWLMGHQARLMDKKTTPSNVYVYDRMKEFVDTLKTLKKS